MRLLRWWRNLRWKFSSDRLYEINREMYYEQAERDGVDYPPQYRGP